MQCMGPFDEGSPRDILAPLEKCSKGLFLVSQLFDDSHLKFTLRDLLSALQGFLKFGPNIGLPGTLSSVRI